MNEKFGSVLRHALTTAAGVLVTVGVDQAAAVGLANALVPVIGGIVSYGIGQAWSLLRLNKIKIF